MLIPRRTFVKGLSYLLGAIPLPGVVKQAFASSEGIDNLEDVEMILRGLIARCVNGPITQHDAELMGSFLKRFDVVMEAEKVVEVEREGRAAYAAGDRDAWEKLKGDPRWGTGIRFITQVTKGMRPKPWFSENFKKVNKTCMQRIVDVFNQPAMREHHKRF